MSKIYLSSSLVIYWLNSTIPYAEVLITKTTQNHDTNKSTIYY